MAEGSIAIKASVGFASETGPRERNEDFAGAVFGMELPRPRREIIAALADGIGGARGGGLAAGNARPGFFAGVFGFPPTIGIGPARAPRRQPPHSLGLFPKPPRT